jgi:hypothetical protein
LRMMMPRMKTRVMCSNKKKPRMPNRIKSNQRKKKSPKMKKIARSTSKSRNPKLIKKIKTKLRPKQKKVKKLLMPIPLTKKLLLNQAKRPVIKMSMK